MGLSRKNQFSSVIIVYADLHSYWHLRRKGLALSNFYITSKGITMKKAILPVLVGLGLMVGATSTLSAGCGCPKIHFGCKKAKHVKKVKKAKKSCGFHFTCPTFSCKKK